MINLIGALAILLVGVVAMVGILLFAPVAATDVLGQPALSAVVTDLRSLSGPVPAGLLRSSGRQQGGSWPRSPGWRS